MYYTNAELIALYNENKELVDLLVSNEAEFDRQSQICFSEYVEDYKMARKVLDLLKQNTRIFDYIFGQ